ncbi:MAG: sugar transferase [Actinomycetota bacterium]
MSTLTIPGSTAAAVPAVGARSGTRRAWLPKALMVGADAAAVAAAMVIAFELRTLLPGPTPLGAESQHLLLGALSLPLWLAVFSHYRLYTSRFLASRLEESRRVVHAVMVSVLAIAVVGFMLKLYVARGWLVLSFLAGVATVLGERELVRRTFARLRRKGRYLRPVVIIGANTEGLALCGMLMDEPTLGYRVVGFVDADSPMGTYVYDHRPVLGAPSDACAAISAAGATSAIIVTSAVDAETCNRLARELIAAGIHVELSSSLRDVAIERLSVRPLGRYPIMYVQPVRTGGWRSAAKRGFDVTASAGVLLLTTPLLVLVALAVKLDSRGPVLFRQERVGRKGERFQVLKFRTMAANAEELIIELRQRNEADGPLFKIKDDPRVTRVGRLLRRYSLDEVPQLWNVVRGQMSLVGPRPALADEMRHWDAELHNRLQVKPGITGMWQVNGRSNATFADYVRLDLYYVDNWSLWTDLAIVAKTVPAVLSRRGAY